VVGRKLDKNNIHNIHKRKKRDCIDWGGPPNQVREESVPAEGGKGKEGGGNLQLLGNLRLPGSPGKKGVAEGEDRLAQKDKGRLLTNCRNQGLVRKSKKLYGKVNGNNP